MGVANSDTRDAGTSTNADRRDRYVPALGYRWLTGFYDTVLVFTLRESTFKRRLLNQSQISPASNVLDLACGTGTLAILAKQTVPDSVIAGLDGDPTVLSIAEKKIEKAGCAIQLHCGWSHELPFGDDSFDRVLSSLFFHHLTLQDKRQTLLEIFRVLKPGGELHVADWGKPDNGLMRALFYSIQLLDGFDTTRDNVAGSLPTLFEEAGFEQVTIRGTLSTIYGTLALYSASKPAGSTPSSPVTSASASQSLAGH